MSSNTSMAPKLRRDDATMRRCDDATMRRCDDATRDVFLTVV
ncbi:hypothetical protein [Pseudomonas helleri]|nr:hypothetical protein [Pseudomonas helleri]